MRAKITIVMGWKVGQVMPFDRDIVVGRDEEECDFVLVDRMASRRHCRFVRLDDRSWAVEDLGSSNGTFVNKKRVTERTPLADGAEVRVGDTMLRFTLEHV